MHDDVELYIQRCVDLITALTTLESERAPHRRNDGFRRRATSKPSMASSLLLDFVKLIKEPVAYAEDALLGEGTFRPTDTDSVETIDVPKLDNLIQDGAEA